MALVTFTGYPCSGKSTRALELESYLNYKLQQESTNQTSGPRLKIIIINDESLSLSKSSYDDSKSEKPSRATLLSAVVRHLNKETIVIVDAMNYIKGSRYQMYLTAREVGVRFCTVFVAATPEKCREWNESRIPETARYLDTTLDNLISRYEEPSSAARWDSPLILLPSFDPPITIPSSTSSSNPDEAPIIPVPSIPKTLTLQSLSISSSSTSESNETTPAETPIIPNPSNAEAERIWQAITFGILKPPNSATQSIQTSTPHYLTLLSSSTLLLLTTLTSLQTLQGHPLIGNISLSVPTTPTPTKVTMRIQKSFSLALGMRLRRDFTKLQQQTSGGGVQGGEMSESGVVGLFAAFLEANL